MGDVEPVQFDSYAALSVRFQEEVEAIWKKEDEELAKGDCDCKEEGKNKDQNASDNRHGGLILCAISGASPQIGPGRESPAQITLIFEDPSDLMRVLSAERVRVLRAVREKPIAVSKLASDLKGDRQAVRRDVDLLESFGLLKSQGEANPGHGRRRVVERLAGRCELAAVIENK